MLINNSKYTGTGSVLFILLEEIRFPAYTKTVTHFRFEAPRNIYNSKAVGFITS